MSPSWLNKKEMPKVEVWPFYIQNHIPVKLKESHVKHRWWNMATGSSPHLKPILVGAVYRPPTANSHYLDNVWNAWYCMWYQQRYFLCVLNIYWLASSCPLGENTSNCNQCLQSGSGYQSTYQGSYNQHRNEIIMYWSHHYYCCRNLPNPIGCSYHIILAISRKTKVPKATPITVYRRSYIKFCSASYVVHVKNIS
jgi:hypothetical protein